MKTIALLEPEDRSLPLAVVCATRRFNAVHVISDLFQFLSGSFLVLWEAVLCSFQNPPFVGGSHDVIWEEEGRLIMHGVIWVDFIGWPGVS